MLPAAIGSAHYTHTQSQTQTHSHTSVYIELNMHVFVCHFLLTLLANNNNIRDDCVLSHSIAIQAFVQSQRKRKRKERKKEKRQ